MPHRPICCPNRQTRTSSPARQCGTSKRAWQAAAAGRVNARTLHVRASGRACGHANAPTRSAFCTASMCKIPISWYGSASGGHPLYLKRVTCTLSAWLVTESHHHTLHSAHGRRACRRQHSLLLPISQYRHEPDMSLLSVFCTYGGMENGCSTA